jgi:GTPase
MAKTDAWQLGKEKKSGIFVEKEYCVLVGLVKQEDTEREVKEHLDELEFLALTAGAETKRIFIQKQNPDPRTFIGKGKMEEIAMYIQGNSDITLAIFDDDLTGKQTNILEENLKVKIVDRSSLILDIFASRAQTAQAKIQVELAQTQYLLPRLRGLWTHLERQKGGIGMRGPGEQEIETDRRIVRDKIALLKEKLEKIDRQSQTQRKTRGEMIRVALVGYTNVGKSTIMNLLSKSEVLAENKLFATLDTTVRKVVINDMPFLLSDTVGFIRKLPHHLVESFKSTLDEVKESDILLHVVDISHPQYQDHIRTVNQTLLDLGVENKPTLIVFNKFDAYREIHFDKYLDDKTKGEIMNELSENMKNMFSAPNIFISAIQKEGIEELREVMKEMIEIQYTIRYPYRPKTWNIDYSQQEESE